MEKYLKIKSKDKIYTIDEFDIRCDLDRMCKIISGYDKNGMYYQMKVKVRDIIKEEEKEDHLYMEVY